jgi:hypothetical protein
MKEFKKLLFFLFILSFAAGCEAETDLCGKGVPAKIYYTPACSTINGYIILDGSGKTYVFKHDLDEKFQGSGLEVCVEYQVEESQPLTAECTQAEIIIITFLKER